MSPCSQLPAGSSAAACSGRNTERIPWAIHFSGKNDAMTRIHSGTTLNGTYTPEMKFSTVNGSVITGVALAADRGTLLAAMPSSEQAAAPSRNTQANVHHLPGSVGRCRW